MSGFVRMMGIAAVYVVALIAWLVLGGVTQGRASDQEARLGDAVSSLWGEPQVQAAPELSFLAEGATEEKVTMPVDAAIVTPTLNIDGVVLPVQVNADGSKFVVKSRPALGTALSLSNSDIDVRLHSDPRQKGLVWFPLYDVGFTGAYGYEHREPSPGVVRVRMAFPSGNASVLDELVFTVNGKDRRDALDPKTGVFELTVPVKQGDKLTFGASYESRGSGAWSYRPAQGVQRLENFRLGMATDFKAIDFPESTLSPSVRTPTESGWKLSWALGATVTAQGIGMTMPQHIQPGELAAALAFSAPVSLLFFFVVLFVLATLRNIDIHPINYLFISSAFFAFHLLFSYSVDHLSVPVAFAICSVVSMGLVVSYLRLVVSTQFALRETALAQLVYLIVFSLAHFWEGFTGLTITVLAILTLFVLMQATGRIKWSEALNRKRPADGGRPWSAPPADAPAATT